MTNRGAIAAAFVAGAMLVAVAVVAYGGAAPTAEMSLAEKKAALAALSQQTMQELKVIRFGADRFGDTGKESGNRGAEWNVGSFPTASSPGFKHNYWDYGAKAGTFAKFAIDEHSTCLDHTGLVGTKGCAAADEEGPGQLPGCDGGCVKATWINDDYCDVELKCYCAENVDCAPGENGCSGDDPYCD